MRSLRKNRQRKSTKRNYRKRTKSRSYKKRRYSRRRNMRGGSLDVSIKKLFIPDTLPDGTPITESNLLGYQGDLTFQQIKAFLINNINPNSTYFLGDTGLLNGAKKLIGVCTSTSQIVDRIRDTICS